jgi:hypothetical protein
MNKKNVPERVLAKFNKMQEDQEASEKKRMAEEEDAKNKSIEDRRSTWKFKYIKHDFKKTFSLPIPNEKGEVFSSLTQNEADELNATLSEGRASYRYRKFKTYLGDQQKILVATYGKAYPLINKYLRHDAEHNPKNLYYLNNRINEPISSVRFVKSDRGNSSDCIQIGLPNLPSRKRKIKE